MCSILFFAKEIYRSNPRYHHKLKSHCLGGKRNWRIDYVIEKFMTYFISDCQNWHKRQLVGLEGPDLEEVCCEQILESARNISPDSIHLVSNTEFLVTSESNPGHRYLIDLTQSTCDCKDFPRIWLCKHIAAVNEHFPALRSKGSSFSKIPECMHDQDLPQSAPKPNVDEECIVLLKDINTLCQQLTALSNDATPDLEALKTVKHSLKAVIALANGSWALPEKDDFNPNQKTWAETAERMGARKAPRRKPSPSGGNITEQCIGAVKGKRCKYSDPYAAGERSGKRAKPNAVSATANDHACATVSLPPPSAATLSPAHASPSAAAVGSAEGSITHVNPSTGGPLAYLPSSTVPGLAFSTFPATWPGSTFAPPSAASPGLAYAGTNAQVFFRAEITPRNAFAHPHFTPGPST